MARSNRSLWLATAIAFAMILGLPAGVAAQGNTAFAWAVSAVDAPAGSSKWGSLTLRDGVLTVAMTNKEWQTPLAEIKRVAESRRGDRTMEIETLNGEVLVVSILGQQMLTESPRKAIQIIERAVRTAPASRRTPAAAAAGGGGSN
jgi:hypothetical protein